MTASTESQIPSGTPPQFLFATCRLGAEPALKAEFARRCPAARPAYARPGFLTFKLSDEIDPNKALSWKSVFARARGISLGRACGDSDNERAESVWQLAGERTLDRLHVWSRDSSAAKARHTDPSVATTSIKVRDLILAHAPEAFDDARRKELIALTRRRQRVLDCVVVESDEWWIGDHRAQTREASWPGGIWPGEPPPQIISRAYLKMAEALDWSALPIKDGQMCVELGCAPGGASQALLERGLMVTGIDPAQVDPSLLTHSHFRYVQKRGRDVPRRAFRRMQWLVADLNVAPDYTLSVVEDIVTHPSSKLHGLIINLKLLDWTLAEEVPEYLERVRRWGYERVAARQLSHGGQEVCVVGARRSLPRAKSSRHRSARKASSLRAAPGAQNRT